MAWVELRALDGLEPGAGDDAARAGAIPAGSEQVAYTRSAMGRLVVDSEARSLAAEALGLDSTHDPADFGFHFQSCGVSAVAGAPASANSWEVMQQRGLDLSSHSSSPPFAQELRDCDHVYCLTRSHFHQLADLLPPDLESRLQLLDPAGEDVPDPFGGPISVYLRCAAYIEDCLRARLADWV